VLNHKILCIHSFVASKNVTWGKLPLQLQLFSGSDYLQWKAAYVTLIATALFNLSGTPHIRETAAAEAHDPVVGKDLVVGRLGSGARSLVRMVVRVITEISMS